MEKLPNYIQVSSTLEFSRLVCALERIPRVSFLHDHEGEKVVSVQMDLLKERPIIYFAPLNHDGNYLCYGFKAGKEESTIENSASDSTRLYSPIIKIKSLPSSLKPDNNNQVERYQPLELEDLSSLAKLSFGLEESPFPLFTFPNDDKWLMGVFMNFNEEGESYFCHVVLDEEPDKPFLKYSTNNGINPSFVKNTGEHGYSYIKIIRLKDRHPLVNYDQIQN